MNFQDGRATLAILNQINDKLVGIAVALDTLCKIEQEKLNGYKSASHARMYSKDTFDALPLKRR